MTTTYFEISQCPHCRCQFQIWCVGSCNTFGATFYTDGFIDGDMYDEDTKLVVCPECGKYLWRYDIPGREEIPDHTYFKNPGLRAIPHAGSVFDEQWEEALNSKVWKNASQEKYLRVRAWRFFNNTRRNNIAEEFDLPPSQKENLVRLLELLDENDPGDSIMKAEILRQLGRFDECLKQLDQQFDADYQPILKTIKKLAEMKKRNIGKIK